MKLKAMKPHWVAGRAERNKAGLTINIRAVLAPRGEKEQDRRRLSGLGLGVSSSRICLCACSMLGRKPCLPLRSPRLWVRIPVNLGLVRKPLVH